MCNLFQRFCYFYRTPPVIFHTVDSYEYTLICYELFFERVFVFSVLRDKLGSSISSAGMAEGNVRDGPAVIDTLMKNAK